MRSAILLCLFVIFGCVANAQFTILPQVGFENSRTSIEFNKRSSFSPLGAKLSPQAGIRLDYKFKQGHGPFLGITTSRSVIKYNFSDPETVMTAYTASKGNTQLRIEGGYQVSTKPIYFKKQGSNNKSSTVYYQRNGTEKKSCGSSIVKHSCESKTYKTSVAKYNERGVWVRIQPSAGLAYIPSVPRAEIFSKSQGTQTSYQYNAGNWNTALIAGMGFEFGRNKQSKFIVSINYLKGIGNLDTKSITTVSGNKPTTTSLKSDASGWNITMGIPISLNKKKPVAKQQFIEKIYKEQNKCGQYKSHCMPRCSKRI